MLSTNPVKIYIRKEERSLTNNLNFWGWQWAHHLPYQNSRWWSHKWVPDTHVRDLGWLLGSQLSPGPGGVTVSFFLSLWDKMWRRKITEILMIMILYIVLGWCVYLCLIFKVYLFERHWEGENLASSGSLLKWLQQLGLSQEKASSQEFHSPTSVTRVQVLDPLSAFPDTLQGAGSEVEQMRLQWTL